MNDYVNMLTLESADYPQILKNLPTAPTQLYWQGVAPEQWLSKPKVAIVGSRRMTAYGQAVTSKLATELTEAGVVIISGLAFGVDVTAHKAALAAQGVTVAVLASSLDNITPSSHYHIARQIQKNGTLISERPPGSVVNRGLFVIRNRIISGLADIVLIPEAVLKSGSLHTARFAMEQGKTVMAVPGNITSPASEGCNNLIKSGAIPVTSVDDIFFALNMFPDRSQRSKNFKGTEAEASVYNLIKEGVADQEELLTAAGIDSSSLSSTLTMLELSGYIRPAGAGNWIIA